MDKTGEISLPELHRRKIDRDVQGARPRARLVAGLAEDALAHRENESAFLGNRNERPRQNETACRMLPAHERLEADHLAADPRLRLVMKHELIVRHGRAQIVNERATLAQLLV